ncbi:MAG: HAMP domain-containing protein [Elusimicrobia bacterium]|nr:HAMP domain-containing protein [Elusimicrobiota bacterium]
MKLTTRFFLILLFIAVFPLVISIVWNIKQYKTTIASFFDLHQGIASFAASNVEEWYSNVNKSLTFIYEIENPFRPKQFSEVKAIQQATATNSDIVALHLIAKDNSEIFSIQSDKVKSRKSLNRYQEILVDSVRESGKASPGEILCLESQPYFPLAYPLLDGRVILLHFSIEKLWKKISLQKTGETGKVVLIDSSARPLPCQNISGDIDVESFRKFYDAKIKSGLIDKLILGREKYAGAWAYIKNPPWILISVQKHSELYGPQRRSMLVLTLFSVITLFTSIGVVLLISKKILNPLGNIIHGVKRISTNDLTSTIPTEGWPEIKNLISVFNRMMLELQAYRAFQLNQIVEEKNKAQVLVDTIPDGVLLSDDQNKIIYSNQTALNLLGIGKISPDAALPKSIRRREFYSQFTDIVSSKEKFIKSDVDVLVSEEPPITKSYRILSSQFMLATLKKPGRITILRDVTSEKEVEKAKEDFFHMITHDMRAPLASIQGYVEILAKTIPPSPKTEKYFSSMLYSSRRLRGMIDDILNTTKLEKGTMALQLEQVGLSETLNRAKENHEPVAVPKNISITVLPSPAEIKVYADSMLLERVISNLLGNALKFTPTGGRIVLSVAETEAESFVSVEDTGPGIPEDKRQSIFEKYSQMEEHKHMGFGLGLAMCKMVVGLHKGRIWVESEKGKGSRFIFTLAKSLMPEEAKK